jgi:hypothetical protein
MPATVLKQERNGGMPSTMLKQMLRQDYAKHANLSEQWRYAIDYVEARKMNCKPGEMGLRSTMLDREG